jgi:hypothetical protein
MDHMFKADHWWNPGYWWLDTGLQSGCREMKRILQQDEKILLCYREIPGARHNERAWSQRIDKPLLHLFGTALQ